MERENFYILLDLSYDPPENDISVINRAISAKKAQWSRLRNHPTKGLQIQKYLNLIPEIQAVMQDPERRRQEAEAAKALVRKGQEAKFAEVDRHIDILMGKGFIAKEEIARLAEMHDIPQHELQERINSRKQEKYSRIDLEVGYRMAKGYLTEAEIARLAKRHSLSIDEIKSRVRCPITRDAKDQDGIKPKQIDPSINKSIHHNLSIVSKSSLYDFLDLPASAPITMLQEKSGQKKKQLASISKKDAVATASSILAGHCMTLFKNDESRLAYDISLSQSFLSDLDSDIDVAAINGSIRPEYLGILVEKAMGFGMDEDEALEYIKSYGKQKKYKIDRDPNRRKRLVIISAAGAFLAVLAVAAFMVFSAVSDKHAAEADYQAMLARVDGQPALEQKLQLLNDYLRKTPESRFAPAVNEKINGIKKQMAKAALDAVEAEASRMAGENDFENAISAYREFLNRHPDSPFKSEVSGRIDKIEKQIEASDYQQLVQVMQKGEVDEKIASCLAYLEKHPKGAHKAQAEAFIQEMSSEYYIYINREFSKCKEKEDWEGCLKLCNAYIALYDNSNSDLLKQLIPVYEEKRKHRQTFETLVEKTAALGTDYATARQIYTDYLEAYPETTVRDKVELELARIEQMAQTHRIEQKKKQMRDLVRTTGGRFVETADGVVVDVRTGLMWCLVDSGITLENVCVSYEKAKAYVDQLDTGGYTDWRLPTPAELSSIYQTAPTFPAPAEHWYWTSESFSSYADGWHTKVATVLNQSGKKEVTRRDDRECGAVRAVRGKGK